MLRCLFILILLIASSVPTSASQPVPKGEVRIGYFSLEPISFQDEQGTAQGLNPDLLRKVAAIEGWQAVFVYGSWGEGMDRLEAGEIDLMMNVAYTADRAKRHDYTLEPVMELWGQVFVKPQSGVASISDLAGKRVGIMRRGINGQNFIKTTKELGIATRNVAYENLRDIFSAVQAGEIDGGVSPQHFGQRYAREYGLTPSPILFSPFPIYFTSKKGEQRQLLMQIDYHLKRWKEDENSFYYQRLNHWLGKQTSQNIIPRWIMWALLGIGLTAVFLLCLSLLFKQQLERKTAEIIVTTEKLKERESHYRNLINSMVQPMTLHEIIYDEKRQPVDLRLLEVNPAFAKVVGASVNEINGKNFSQFMPDIDPQLLQAFNRVVTEGKPVHFEIDEKMFGRRYDIVAYSPSAGLCVAIGTDVTERVRNQREQEKLQSQLYHAQKLESLGVLAGGIAHDFNNILMAILGHCELALRRLPVESPAKSNIEEIKNSANKAAELSNQMLAYSGKGKFIIEPLDLSKIVVEMQQMLAVSVNKKALLRYQLAEQLPSVEADATQLRQIILNLVINASDAIGGNNGVITITTGVMDCRQSDLQAPWITEELAEGRYVCLEVADTGSGMDRKTVNRIFDPFFTTKFTGRGLGMAAVLGIVRGHKGAIKIGTEEGQGTTFKVLLKAVGTPAAQTREEAELEPLQGSGTVLLVDDDETVLSIAQEMLTEFGFSVIIAKDGRDAVEKFQQAEDIRFVLMDLTMPNLDGEQAFLELQRLDPQVKVIMSSGYNQQEVVQKFAGKGICGFLKKPYQLSALQAAIQKLEG